MVELFKNFFKGKTVTFYIALGLAGLSLFTSIFYAASIGGLGEYMSWGAFVLLLLAGFVFAALALFEFPNIGVAIMACMNFGALILSAVAIYEYFISLAMVGLETAGASFPLYIVSAVLMLIDAVAGNVVAWLRLAKKKKDAPASETSAGNVEGGNHD